MASSGIFQLKKLVINLCPHGGSSNGIRTLLQSKEFEAFKTKNPQIEIVVQDRKQRHPFVEGTYVNGNSKQIGVKNRNPENILEVISFLRNQCGEATNQRSLRKRQVPEHRSIQGVWTPETYSQFKLNEVNQTITESNK